MLGNYGIAVYYLVNIWSIGPAVAMLAARKPAVSANVGLARRPGDRHFDVRIDCCGTVGVLRRPVRSHRLSPSDIRPGDTRIVARERCEQRNAVIEIGRTVDARRGH